MSSHSLYHPLITSEIRRLALSSQHNQYATINARLNHNFSVWFLFSGLYSVSQYREQTPWGSLFKTVWRNSYYPTGILLQKLENCCWSVPTIIHQGCNTVRLRSQHNVCFLVLTVNMSLSFVGSPKGILYFYRIFSKSGIFEILECSLKWKQSIFHAFSF